MKYKVGDVVIIKKDLKKGFEDEKTGCFFNDDMEEFCGKRAKITSVRTAGYDIDIDKGEWCWVDAFFEDTISTPSQLEKGDVVTLRNGDKLLYSDDKFFDLSNKNSNLLSDVYDLKDDTFKYEDRDEKENDIVKVERPIEYREIYNESNEVKEMTLEEICSELGYNVKIVKNSKKEKGEN